MSMRFPKVLVLGLVGSLLVGGLVFALSSRAAWSAIRAQDSGDTSFSIPIGRVGDEIEYLVHGQRFQEGDGSPSNRTGHYAHGFRVLEPSAALDRTMDRHETIPLEYVYEWPASDNYRAHGTEHYALGARDLIHAESLYEGYRGATREEVRDVYGTYLDYGPTDFDPYGYAENWDFPVPAFLLKAQGRTFEIGQDLTAEDLRGPLLSAILARDRADITVGFDSFQYRSWVDAYGTIGTYQVFSIVRHLQLNYRMGDTTTFGFVKRDILLDRAWQEDDRTTFWFSPELPWPVRVERVYARQGLPGDGWMEGIQNYTVVRDLAKYSPGGSPIPWAEADKPYRPTNPDAERSGETARHPAGGNNSRISFTLEEALESVRSDARLTEFRAWQSRHPDHLLVGLAFHPQPAIVCVPAGLAPQIPPAATTSARTCPTWNLVFGYPSAAGSTEQAFVVSSGRQTRDAPPVNKDWGAVGLTANRQFKLEDLPRNPITLDYADRVWRDVGPLESTARIPEFILWGYMPRFSPTLRVTGGPWFHQINVGVYTEIPSPTVDAPMASQRTYDNVWLNASSGNVTSVFFFRWKEASFALDTALTSLLDEGVRPASVPMETSRADPFVAAVVTLSLLSALVLAYFLPLLKVFGTRILLVIPGYAKLRKAELLNSHLREELVNLIRNDPGISPPELQRAVQAGFSTVVYHLDVLQKNGLVNSLIDGRHKRFFPCDAIDWSRRGQISALRNAKTRALYDFILTEPGVFRDELARRMGLTAPGAIWHLERLEAAGLIGHDKVGRKMHYYPQAPAAAPRLVDQKEAVEVA